MGDYSNVMLANQMAGMAGYEKFFRGLGGALAGRKSAEPGSKTEGFFSGWAEGVDPEMKKRNDMYRGLQTYAQAAYGIDKNSTQSLGLEELQGLVRAKEYQTIMSDKLREQREKERELVLKEQNAAALAQYYKSFTDRAANEQADRQRQLNFLREYGYGPQAFTLDSTSPGAIEGADLGQFAPPSAPGADIARAAVRAGYALEPGELSSLIHYSQPQQGAASGWGLTPGQTIDYGEGRKGLATTPNSLKILDPGTSQTGVPAALHPLRRKYEVLMTEIRSLMDPRARVMMKKDELKKADERIDALKREIETLGAAPTAGGNDGDPLGLWR